MSYRLDLHEFRAWLSWAEAFVRQVDALHPFPLTPAIALRILDKTER